MFCGKCGTKLKDGAKFCQNCGVKVNSVSNSVEKKIRKEQKYAMSNMSWHRL